MREVLIREYEVLISTPSDVCEYVGSIKSAIADYNNEQGVVDHIRFIQKNWKEHIVPNYGKSAQAIINEQLTNQAEIVIALFGAKFGEPTERYSSGTLEEIETVYQNGGRVLTYFLTGKIDLTSIDPDQLKKVKEYKQTYKGLYGEFSTDDELKRKVYESLVRIAIDLKNDNRKDLKLCAVKDGELSDELTFSQYGFLNCSLMKETRNDIKKIIEEISAIKFEKIQHVPITLDENSKYYQESMTGLSKKLNAISAIASVFPKEKIIFNEKFQEYVKRFCNENGIDLLDEFFDLGNAGYSGNNLMGYSLCGDDSEKKKADLLIKLEEKILVYYHLVEFLQQYKDKFYLILAIKNESNIFADDITVKLYFDRGVLISPFSFSIKEKDIGKIVKCFPEIFEHKDNVDIENMDYGKADYPNFIPYVDPLTGISSEPDLEYYQDYFNAKTEELYPILINEKGKQTIVKIDLKNGVKQFSSQFLCASLIFMQPVDNIKYCITSKTFGQEIKGELKTDN